MAAMRRPQLGSLPGPGGLDQGRMGDGLGYSECVRVGGRSLDAQFDNMGDALSVGHDLPGQRRADLRQCAGELGISWAGDGAAGSRGQQEHGVVGRGVAVHRDAVEADFDGLAQIAVEHCRLDGGVGEHIDQHGGVRNKLRVDHARALAAGRDANLPARSVRPRNVKTRKGGLLHRVGRENGLGRLAGSGRIPRPSDAARPGSAAISLSAGSGTPMMPVEEGKTSSGLQPKTLSGGGAGGVRSVEAGCSGGAVGVAGVDGNHAHLAARRPRCSLSTMSGAAMTRLR